MASLQHLRQMTDQQAMALWQAPPTTAHPPSESAGHPGSTSNAQEPVLTVEHRDKRPSQLQKSHALALLELHPSPEAQYPDTKTCAASVNLVVAGGLTATAET